jgi:hypothetical protein
MPKHFRFLHLGIDFKNVTNTALAGQVEAILNSGKDWFRYSSNCWLIYTARDPQEWHERLKQLTGITEHTYLICAADLTERAGCLPKPAWDWIESHH